MKIFDFKTVVDRSGTGSWKYEAFGSDVLPVWVADMDFRSPPCVLDALHNAIDHGIFGYSAPRKELIEIIQQRLDNRHNWKASADSLVFLPGLVVALNLATRMLPEGSEVLIPTPAYPPFLSAAPNQKKSTVKVPMVRDDGRWRFDFDALQAAVTPQTKMLILCNPHNPTGRSFSREELAEIAGFIQKNDLLLVCDEIHCDIIIDPSAQHLSIGAEFPEIKDRTITLLSPSKTFNLAGIGCAFAVIENPELRKRFAPSDDDLVPHVNQLGFVAMEAAYRDGEPWRLALMEQLRENAKIVEKTVSAIPGLSMIPPEATYLAWIDCTSLGLENPSALFLKHKLAVGSGSYFSADQFVRINFACPPSTLKEAMRRFKGAVSGGISDYRSDR